MFEKIKFLLTSLRFWQILFAWLAVYVGLVITNGFSIVELLNSLAGLFGSISIVGTIDKFSSVK